MSRFADASVEGLRLELNKGNQIYIKTKAFDHLVTWPCFCFWGILSETRDGEAGRPGQWGAVNLKIIWGLGGVAVVI